MSSPTYHHLLPDARSVGNGHARASHNFVHHHNNNHQTTNHSIHNVGANKHQQHNIPRDTQQQLHSQHQFHNQHQYQQPSRSYHLSHSPEQHFTDHHQNHVNNHPQQQHYNFTQPAVTHHHGPSTSLSYHASSNNFQINPLVHHVLSFTSIDAIIPFANNIIHTASASSSSNNPFQIMLRAALEVLDIWVSTLFESFSKPLQLLLALPVPESLTLTTAAYAFIETHQTKLIFDHLKFQLLCKPAYSDYILDLNERSNLYIQCCRLAGTISCTLHEYNYALTFYQKVLQRQPNSPEIYFSSGLIYRILGLPNQAENYWRYTLRLDPLNWEAIEQLTTYFNSHQRQDESIALIQETISASTTSDAMARIQANPHDWAKYLLLYHSLGDLYMLKNKFYDAATTFTILIAMALSTNDTVINDLGLSADITDSLEVPTSEADKAKTFLQDLILKITSALQRSLYHNAPDNLSIDSSSLFFSISPQLALSCRYNVFPPNGLFPAKANTKEWAKYLSAPLTTGTTTGSAKPNVSPLDNVVSNALLNLAKIFQDGISSGISARIIYIAGVVPSHFDLLALYMLSLSLNPSPSTANNIGILLASLSPNLSNIVPAKAKALTASAATTTSTAGIAGGKNPRELAVQYYNYGLTLDPANPHIFSNYGSLLRDLGRPKEAILMYQKAVDCQPQFNIALTNLASALRDQGQVDQAISYYRRAVNCSPNFVEAVSGLANSQASVCDWTGRGGYGWEKVSVDANGMLVEGQIEGWISKIAGIVDKQISDARLWGIGVIESELKKQAVGDTAEPSLMDSFEKAIGGYDDQTRAYWTKTWQQWMGRKDEGVMIVQLIEVVIRMCQRRWYLDRLKGREHADPEAYCRPRIPNGLHIPLATTILPFHAFTLPFNAMQISQISQRTSVRISMSALLQSWLPTHVFAPPPPPAPIADHDGGHLVVGYVSSDFLDHPLAHLMQSVFGMHDRTRFTVICYATTPSDNSSYRTKIEAESHVFRDVSDWTSEAIIKQIQADGVHILVNLNGFTRGSRNDLFAVRPCPVQISLIGFAGSLGGGWCDYLLGDVRTIGTLAEVGERDWVYKENILYMPRSFFVCDHRQSAPDSCAQRERSAALALTMGTQHYASFDEIEAALFDGSFPAPSARATTPLLNHVLMTPGLTIPWSIEQQLRVELRRETFPHLPPDAFLMANLNQLYKIDPTTFRMWLNILQRAPRAYLWLLQFPKTGEAHLMATARKWTNNDESVVSRILFTPIAEKSRHILRARACDLFIDTPECNAHTTAADVAWSGTPIVTLQRHVHKMCSRVSASVIECALTMPPPDAADGDTMEDVQAMVAELIPRSEEEYADRVVHYATTEVGRARLERIRRRIYDNRERDGGFFDTRAWVRCVETGFRQAWADWLRGETRDIYIE